MITAWNPKAKQFETDGCFFCESFSISTSNRALDSRPIADCLELRFLSTGFIRFQSPWDVHHPCSKSPGIFAPVKNPGRNETKLLQVSSWNHHTACRCRAKVWQKRKACCNRVVEKKRLLCWVVVWNIFYVHSYFGEMHQFDEHIFSDGLVQPPTSFMLWCVFVVFLFPVSFLLYKTPKGWNIFFGCVPSTKKHRSLKVFEHETGKGLEAFHWMGPVTSYKWSYIYAPISRVK